MTASLIANLLLESEPERFETVVRSRNIEFVGGPKDIDHFDGEARIVWTGQLQGGRHGISGIIVGIESIKVWGDLVTLGPEVYAPPHPMAGEPFENEEQIEIEYPEGPAAVPDDADASEMADALSAPRWRVELSGETTFPRRPDTLIINFDKRLLEVMFE